MLFTIQLKPKLNIRIDLKPMNLESQVCYEYYIIFASQMTYEIQKLMKIILKLRVKSFMKSI